MNKHLRRKNQKTILKLRQGKEIQFFKIKSHSSNCLLYRRKSFALCILGLPEGCWEGEGEGIFCLNIC